MAKQELIKAVYKTVKFKSLDDLEITADYYKVANAKGLILLCHRSHSNRAEYREIAPKLNKLGFSCFAIDQRSGMNVFTEINQTSSLAKAKGLATGYLDAKQDIESAIEYCFKENGNKQIILCGSSYSASLALIIAQKSNKVKAVLAFSPGEYLKGIVLKDEIKNIKTPIFVTCTKKEIAKIEHLFEFVSPNSVSFFKAKVDGFHGAKTLWQSVNGFEQYWLALNNFLKQFD